MITIPLNMRLPYKKPRVVYRTHIKIVSKFMDEDGNFIVLFDQEYQFLPQYKNKIESLMIDTLAYAKLKDHTAHLIDKKLTYKKIVQYPQGSFRINVN